MKHLKHLFTALLMLCATAVAAHDFEVGGIYYNILSEEDKTVAVTYNGSSYLYNTNEYKGHVTIPATVVKDSNTYTVTTIGGYTFAFCEKITGVTIPNTINKIGQSAFLLNENCGTNFSSVYISDLAAWCNIDFGDYESNPLNRAEEFYLNDKLLTDIVIPNSVDKIKDYAFYWCNKIKSVTFHDGITSIGTKAFYYCKGLTSIEIPGSVKSIGDDAFYGCSGLESVYISDLAAWCDIDFADNPLNYAKNFYLNGNLITDLIIPADVTTIKNSAFANCSGLQSVTIPNSVTSIGSSAFSGCTGLSSIEIPNSVTTIHGNVFSGCEKLTSIIVEEGNTMYDSRDNCNAIIETETNTLLLGCKSTIIPSTITSIGDGAFSGCTGLTNIEIPNNVTRIDRNAFSGCTGLSSIEIPNGNLYSDIFSNCSGLTSVTLGNGITGINYYAFRGCSNLRVVYNNSSLNLNINSIYIPSNTRIVLPTDDIQGDYVFRTTSGVHRLVAYLGNDTEITLPEDYKGSNYEIGESSFSGNSGLTSVTIPNSVTSIGNDAFYNCTGLTSVTIPNSVTSIENSAFGNCNNLAVVFNNSSLNITVGSTGHGYIAYYANIVVTPADDIQGDYVFRTTSGVHKLVAYFGNDTEITLPENYNGYKYEIADKAFKGCRGLTSVTIPNGVTSIGNSAFYNCTGLTSVVIGNSVTSIGNSAFYYCTSLTSIEIPNSVTNIGSNAFYGCSSLENVCISDLVAWCGIDFNASNPLSYAKNFYLNGNLITDLIIPADVTTIKNNAFANCSGLQSVTIPNSVTSIGSSAFSGCTGLSSIEIPNSVTSIGNYAFDGCTGLSSIEIPNSVTSIGNGAFYNCSGVTDIVIGSSVATIGEYAFEDCYKLKSIALECDTPPTIYSGTFSSTAATLYVPSGTKAAYQSASYWKYFKSIVEPASGTCGTNVSWTFNRGVLTIDGKGAMNNYSSFNAPWYDIQDKIISVIIKDQITSIGNYSFYNCTSLNSITIGNSVASIGNYSFYNCTSLNSITIGNSVTSIGNGAFYGCLALAIVYNNSALDITSGSSSNGYAGYYAIAILKDTDDIKGNYVFRTTDGTHCLVAYLGNETEIVFPENYNGNDYVIGNRLFYNNKNIVRISIPQGVKSIGEYAFYGCTALQYVNVEHRTPLAIGYSMFYNVAATLYVPYGTKTAYQANYYWSEFTSIEEIVLSEVTVTIGQYGSATYCSPYALDFSEVEGLKAYAATGYKTNSQVVTLTRVQTAEAGVGLFLKGEPGEYVVPVIESTDEYSLNMLVGTLEQTTVNSTDGAMSNYKFTIADGDAAPMFYPFEDGTTLSAGKAYLQIPTAWLPATAQKSLSVRFDDGETTDIDELKGESGEVKTIYDLSGRVVENPTSGIYIIDGKKVIIK